MSGTRRKPGALGTHVEAYRARLLASGYTPGTVRGKLKELGQLGRWMTERGLEVRELDEHRVEQFLADRRTQEHRRTPGLRSFALLLELLRDRDLIAPVAVPPLTALDLLVGRYRYWLVHDRGLAAPTVLRYEALAHRFLHECASHGDELHPETLRGADVTEFLLAECARLSVGASKGKVAELRSLLRFLFLQGLTPLALADAVPPVAGWHDTGLPHSLQDEDVEALLHSCDPDLPAGRRDLAIMMLLARLGLRSAEVARLQLGDLDWRAGEIVVSGKGRREDRLPLPVDVGDALVAYLTTDRPRDVTRHVFLTVRAPRQPIRPDMCSDAVRRACRRVGLPPVGAHRLRHALAATMLDHGVAIIEISQVLRHQDLATTAIYAKVDLPSLRQVARPWPGALQ